ncbi:MAG: S8 family serine peptidase [Fimbriimonas sp.]
MVPLRRLLVPLAALLGLAAAVPAQPRPRKAPRPNGILVAYRTPAAAAAVGRQYRLAEESSARSWHFRRVRPARGVSVGQALATLRRDPRVRWAEVDGITERNQAPNDPKFAEQWGLRNTGQEGGVPGADVSAVAAWASTTGSPNVVVAVVDGGVDVTHPDLAPNIYKDAGGNVIGYDTLDEDANPADGDETGHGTHVAGVAGMAGNNGIGGSGVARQVRIMPVRFSDASGFGLVSDAIEAIDWAVGHGAKILVLSWGTSQRSTLLLEAIRRAEAAGVLVVASAGNQARDIDGRGYYPAHFNRETTNVVSVAASNRFELPYAETSYGRTVDLMAPGEDVLGPVPSRVDATGYVRASGSSFAAGHVAGAAALIRARFASSTVSQIRDRLRYSADRIPAYDGYCAFGRLNAFRALEADVTAPNAPPSPRVTRRSASVLAFEFGAATDEGGGPVVGYDVRASKSPITAGTFAAARAIPTPYLPPAVGTPVRVSVDGLTPGTTWYLAVRSVDEAGNVSPIVTYPAIATRPALWLDTVGDGGLDWTPQSGSAWAVTGSGATAAIADSPAGNYAPNLDATLTMTNAQSVTGPVAFQFQGQIDLEDEFDFLHVEASVNGGAWSTVASLTGSRPPQGYRFLLPLTGTNTVQMRFRIRTDDVTEADGVTLDDFALVAQARIAFDDAEGTAQYDLAQWARTTERSFSPSRSYTDSPGGDAPDAGVRTMAGLTDVATTGYAAPFAAFALRTSLEWDQDFLIVDASTDAGPYRPVGAFTGDGDWARYGLPLPTGVSSRLRFRLVTVGGSPSDGAHLDDIGLYAEPAEAICTLDLGIVLEAYAGPAAGRPLTIELRTPGSTTATTTLSALPPAAGTRLLVPVPATGTMDVAVRAPQFLRKVARSVDLALSAAVLNLSLVNGDVDNDGRITTTDYVIANAQYGRQLGQTGYDARADVTGDSKITDPDLDVIRLNQRRRGDL